MRETRIWRWNAEVPNAARPGRAGSAQGEGKAGPQPRTKFLNSPRAGGPEMGK